MCRERRVIWRGEINCTRELKQPPPTLTWDVSSPDDAWRHIPGRRVTSQSRVDVYEVTIPWRKWRYSAGAARDIIPGTTRDITSRSETWHRSPGAAPTSHWCGISSPWIQLSFSTRANCLFRLQYNLISDSWKKKNCWSLSVDGLSY